MTDLRRACGTLTVAQLNKALKGFPRMTEQSRAIVRSYLVDGRLQVDIAESKGLSRERVRFVCAKVFEAHEKLARDAADRVRAPVANGSQVKSTPSKNNIPIKQGR